MMRCTDSAMFTTSRPPAVERHHPMIKNSAPGHRTGARPDYPHRMMRRRRPSSLSCGHSQVFHVHTVGARLPGVFSWMLLLDGGQHHREFLFGQGCRPRWSPTAPFTRCSGWSRAAVGRASPLARAAAPGMPFRLPRGQAAGWPDTAQEERGERGGGRGGRGGGPSRKQFSSLPEQCCAVARALAANHLFPVHLPVLRG